MLFDVDDVTGQDCCWAVGGRFFLESQPLLKRNIIILVNTNSFPGDTPSCDIGIGHDNIVSSHPQVFFFNSYLTRLGEFICLLNRGCSGVSKGVVGNELFEDSVVAIDAVVASSNEGGVQGGSLPVRGLPINTVLRNRRVIN